MQRFQLCANQQRHSAYCYHIQVVREDKNLDALREDPRFTKLIDEYDEPVFNSGALKWVCIVSASVNQLAFRTLLSWTGCGCYSAPADLPTLGCRALRSIFGGNK